jgi:hypothetical protein
VLVKEIAAENKLGGNQALKLVHFSAQPEPFN